jgi:hypothetical protein
MVANFTSVVLENGLLPIAVSVQKRLGLNPGDQVRISIKVLNRPDKRQTTKARYDELLAEKDKRILTPQERADLIALANEEFDVAIAHAKKFAQKSNPELFDEHGQLKKRKALASLRVSTKRKKTRAGRARKSK